MTPMKKLLVTATLIAAAMLTAFSLGGGVLLWAVSGLLMVAAMVVLMTGEIAKQPSEKGITLQTLIVTAVLVLMAGAAGVVIIAITNNAQDNLEGQNTGVESRCEPWEIFDPTLDAAGRGGGNGGIDSSASGCVRVCYVRFTPAAWTDPTGEDDFKIAGTSGAAVGLTGTKSPTTAELVLSRSNIFDDSRTAPTGSNAADITLPVNNTRGVDFNGNADDEITLTIKSINSETTLNNYEIEVAPNQRYCRVWNTTDDEEVLRSS